MTAPLNPMRVTNPMFVSVFISIWLLMLMLAPMSWLQMLDYIFFSLLGMAGAIFANATGAGGGVILIPFFNQAKASNTEKEGK